MSIDLSLDSLCDSCGSREDFIDSITSWYGREISWDDFEELKTDAKRRIVDLLCRNDHQSALLSFKLAWLGSSKERRSVIEKNVAHLIKTSDGWEVRRVSLKNFRKKISNGCKDAWDKTCEVTSNAWDKTCEAAQKTCDTFAEFWEDYKTEILVGAAIAATGVAVAAIIVYTGGAGAQAAVAGGATLVNSLLDDSAEKQSESSPTASIPSSPLTPPLVQTLASEEIPTKPDCSPSSQLAAEQFSRENLAFIDDDSLTKGPTNPFPSLIFRFDPAPPSSTSPNWCLIFPPTFQAKEESYPSIYSPTPVPPLDQSINKITGFIIPQSFQKRSHIPDQIAPKSNVPDNYTSLVHAGISFSNSPPPFEKIPIVGYPTQSTVHFHCGINNDASSILEGGFRLFDSLNEDFAVQPHLIHSDSITGGLALVGLEKLKDLSPITSLALFGAGGHLAINASLKNSIIQKSINYEVETLSNIAKKILEKNNPKLKQVHITFSNGGHVFKEALKRLSPEQQDTIIVITAGTTAIIDEKLAHKVYNVIGDKDWPSKLTNGGNRGIEATKDRANVDFIHQEETDGVIGGHYFIQPQYQRKISEVLFEEITNEYEIY